MNKLKILLAAILLILFTSSNVFASSGALMKFTDKTRFYKIGSADILSDLILEKLITGGKFHFKETAPLDISEERKLYEKSAAEIKNAEIAMESGSLDEIFEGEGFSKSKASSIDTAVTGQTIQPELIRAIAEKSGVDYLIQGTLENIGLGISVDNSIGSVAGMAGNILTNRGHGKAGGIFGGFSDTRTQKKFLGVEISLRIIETNTGKVVWDKKIIGQSHITKLSNKDVAVGSDRLMDETFHKALNEAAENIVKAILEDTNSQKFF